MKTLLLILFLVINTIDSTYRIGYSTKYGYGFNQNRGIGISLTTYNPNQYYGPRKSPQRPFSGNLWEDFTDWLRMNTDENWPSYVDDDYWEEFLAQYPEYADEAEQWFEEHGKTPPWLLPLTGTDVLFYLGTLYAVRTYGRRKKRKKL